MVKGKGLNFFQQGCLVQFSDYCAMVLTGLKKIIQYLSIYTISQWLVVLIHQVLCTQFGLWHMSSPWAIRKVLCIKFWWSPGHAFNHCPAVTSVANQASLPCSWEQVLSIRSFQLLDVFLISSLLASLDFCFLCLGPRIRFLGNMNRACISFLSGHGS